MEKINYSQLELFSSSKDPSNVKARLSHSFLNYIWNYERMLLIIIGFVITGVISFSLGVEKGKQVAMLKNNFQAIEIHPSTYLRGTNQTQQPPIQKQNIIESPKVKESIQNYTIQLASYKTKTFAQKEAEILKRKGHLPLLLNKSGYAVLCVGTFSNREMAKSLLSELKKRYRDCFIRRL